jgi:hypothetical protein
VVGLEAICKALERHPLRAFVALLLDRDETGAERSFRLPSVPTL